MNPPTTTKSSTTPPDPPRGGRNRARGVANRAGGASGARSQTLSVDTDSPRARGKGSRPVLSLISPSRDPLGRYSHNPLHGYIVSLPVFRAGMGLFDSGKVSSTGDPFLFLVEGSSDSLYQVSLLAPSCPCEWFARYGGVDSHRTQRSACRHLVAAAMEYLMTSVAEVALG